MVLWREFEEGFVMIFVMIFAKKLEELEEKKKVRVEEFWKMIISLEYLSLFLLSFQVLGL